MRVCVQPYYILLGHGQWISLGKLPPPPFKKGNRGGVDVWEREVGEGPGGEDGGETAVRMQRMREE